MGKFTLNCEFSHSVSTKKKKVFCISSVEFYVYKKQIFVLPICFRFMSRFGSVYITTALSVGYVPQRELVLQEKNLLRIK